jgi:tungstate transport system ATP-binding protein
MTEALLQAESISVRRGDRIVLAPCSLSVNSGDRVAIYGPNGAGKSTLLQALAGLLQIASGTLSFRGKKLGEGVPLLDYHRRTAAVFQEPLLLRGTVRHNVELGLKLRGLDGAERDARVQPWLERLRIAHLADRSAGTLSGGEAQRTSLARALALDPEIFFLDEPFAALDAPTRARLADELAEILDERRIATLLVTHDFDEATELCERCVILDAGRVLQQDDMSAVGERPLSRRVAEIIGTSKILEGRVIESGPGKTWLDWNGHRIIATLQVQVGARVEFMIRQEQIRLQTVGNGTTNHVRGCVDHVRRRGNSHLVSVRTDNRCRIEVLCGIGELPSRGEEVAVWFPPDAVWIFPEQGKSTPLLSETRSSSQRHHVVEKAVR